MKTTVLVGIITLFIGFGGGYMTADNKSLATTHVMSGVMADMTSELNDKTDDEFDKTFIKEMIVHHEGAVAMAEQALHQAKHTEIKEMAHDIIDAQTREINMMRDWLQSWYSIN